jgi:S1-C subfamily serine protease
LKAIARQPSFDLTSAAASKRSSKVQTWLDAKVRNIVGEGEMSAHGLPGETGVLVLDAPANTRLARAGIRKDDVIVSVNGKKVESVKDLPASDVTAAAVMRDQNTLHLQLPN